MLLRVAFMTVALGLGISGLAAAASPRVDRIINAGWRFVREDAPGAEKVGFNDADWQTIALPHTWNAHDGQDGGGD